MKSAKAYIDGSGNSARIQACAAILHVDQEKFSRARLLPPHTTNNVGEYNGALLAVDLARELGIRSLEIFSDSLLLVNQLHNLWACRNPALRKLRDRVWCRAQVFDRVEIEWIPRSENKEADELCRQTIKAALRIRA